MLRSTLLLMFTAIFLVESSHPRVPRLDGRITGGVPVTIEQYPHQVSLLYNGKHSCGGSIIKPNAVLTAAQCTNGKVAEKFTVRANSTYRTDGGQIVEVESISQHPKYREISRYYDYSVLHLRENITQGKSILLGYKQVPVGTEVSVSGWGALEKGGANPKQLHAVNISIQSDDKCNKYVDFRADVHICAGVPDGGKGACVGDTGGPLIVGDEQVGIVSWAMGCEAYPDVPDVYAKIFGGRAWIEEVAGV